MSVTAQALIDAGISGHIYDNQGGTARIPLVPGIHCRGQRFFSIYDIINRIFEGSVPRVPWPLASRWSLVVSRRFTKD